MAKTNFYFKKVLIKDCLLQLQKDIEEVIEFVKLIGHKQNQNEIIAENSDKISSLIEKDFKNVNDLFDDFFEELELEISKQRKKKGTRETRGKVFIT